MIASNKKKLITGLFVLLLLISIPLTISLVSRKQDTRGRAAASTTLSFQPSTSAGALQKNVGDPISLDIMVDPGTNLVTFVRYQISYDPSKVQLSPTNPITLNNAVFSSVEGPVTTTNSIAQSVSIGSDPTKAIQKITKIGTINFIALAPTNGTPTEIIYGNLTQALSSGSNDQAGQNILSSTSPAEIAINGTTAISPSVGPSVAPSTIVTPSQPLEGTILSFTMLLHGVGAAGDNPNPTGNSLSNKNPIHPQRNMKIEVFDTNNNVIATTAAPVTYDSATGTFIGQMSLGNNFASGNYNIKVQTDRYLRRLIPGIQQLKSGQNNIVPPTNVVAGDTNGDNFLNAIDYNSLLDCGFGTINTLPMADANSQFNSSNCQAHTSAINIDINDDGIINQFDYNLFLRELSVQNGD